MCRPNGGLRESTSRGQIFRIFHNQPDMAGLKNLNIKPDQNQLKTQTKPLYAIQFGGIGSFLPFPILLFQPQPFLQYRVVVSTSSLPPSEWESDLVLRVAGKERIRDMYGEG